MSDARLLDSLEGQQYLVLRPTEAVARFWESEQAALLEQLPEPVAHPHAGHVTMRGFHEPARVDELRDALRAWAREQNAIELSVDAVDGFPPPFKVLIGRLERTSSLVAAYASLTSALEMTDFVRIGELSLDEWVFHLSLVYCGVLPNDRWEVVHDDASRMVRPQPTETIAEAEFVWYHDGVEHAESILLAEVAVADRTARDREKASP